MISTQSLFNRKLCAKLVKNTFDDHIFHLAKYTHTLPYLDELFPYVLQYHPCFNLQITHPFSTANPTPQIGCICNHHPLRLLSSLLGKLILIRGVCRVPPRSRGAITHTNRTAFARLVSLKHPLLLPRQIRTKNSVALP